MELQDLDDLKARTLLMQNERMSGIMDNINTLETEINKTIKHIYSEKRKMREKVEKVQKDEIKKIFIEKVYNELEQEIEKYEQGIDQAVLNMVEEKQIHDKNKEEEETYKNVAFQIQNGAAIRIQKIIRGKRARRETRMMLINLIRAKTIIVTAFRRFRKRNKGLALFSKIKKLIELRLKWAFKAISSYAEAMESIQQQKKQELFKLEPEIGGTESRPHQPQQKRYSLYQVILMQRILRRYRSLKANNNPGLIFTDINEARENCKICDKNPVDRVCKVCEVSLFCKTCFILSHGRSRAHVYLDLNSMTDRPSRVGELTKNETSELPEKIAKIKIKYRDELVKLEEQLQDLDSQKKGTFELEELEFIFAPKITNKEDLKELLNFAVEKCKAENKNDKDDKTIINYRLLSEFLSA